MSLNIILTSLFLHLSKSKGVEKITMASVLPWTFEIDKDTKKKNSYLSKISITVTLFYFLKKETFKGLFIVSN